MSDNITKADLANGLVSKYPGVVNLNEAKIFIDAALDEINAELARGKSVKISGLGSYRLRRKNARPGRNPKTKEEVTITARTVVNFTASALLRRRIDHSLVVKDK